MSIHAGVLSLKSGPAVPHPLGILVEPQEVRQLSRYEHPCTPVGPLLQDKIAVTSC
jgi:hypothetical protein